MIVFERCYISRKNIRQKVPDLRHRRRRQDGAAAADPPVRGGAAGGNAGGYSLPDGFGGQLALRLPGAAPAQPGGNPEFRAPPAGRGCPGGHPSGSGGQSKPPA